MDSINCGDNVSTVDLFVGNGNPTPKGKQQSTLPSLRNLSDTFGETRDPPIVLTPVTFPISYDSVQIYCREGPVRMY